jgi:hypothetical protein
VLDCKRIKGVRGAMLYLARMLLMYKASDAIKTKSGAGNVNRKEISDQQPQRSQEGSGNQAGS